MYGWIWDEFESVFQKEGDAVPGLATQVSGGDAADDVLAELLLLGGVDDALSGVGDAAVGDFLIGEYEQVSESYVFELVVFQGLPHGVDLGVDLVVDVFVIAVAVPFGDAVVIDADFAGFYFEQYEVALR